MLRELAAAEDVLGLCAPFLDLMKQRRGTVAVAILNVCFQAGNALAWGTRGDQWLG
jgi:hypothetical protein